MKFSISTWLEKIGVTLELKPGAKQIFFYFILPRDDNIFTKIWGIFCKNVLWKKDVLYAVTGLYINYDSRFRQPDK